jgi:hypothetical protein
MRIQGYGIALSVVCFTHRVKNVPKQVNLTTEKRGGMKNESKRKFWKNASDVNKKSSTKRKNFSKSGKEDSEKKAGLEPKDGKQSVTRVKNKERAGR